MLKLCTGWDKLTPFQFIKEHLIWSAPCQAIFGIFPCSRELLLYFSIKPLLALNSAVLADILFNSETMKPTTPTHETSDNGCGLMLSLEE